jgi:putative (di)nucleoside polyphosphate hydrolase
MTKPAQSPHPNYRACVGIMLLNKDGRVFIGNRSPSGGQEHVDATHSWQMPQGGIDKHEDSYAAALRELYEETNVRNVKLLGETTHWHAYNLPGAVANKAWKGRYRGQTQKWFALSFTGTDEEINILSPGGGKYKPEFVDWRWEPIDQVAALIIPFKRAVYDAVITEFRHLAP